MLTRREFEIALVLLVLGTSADAGPYAARRFCSTLIYNENGKPWASEERCQDQLNEWAMEVGHKGVDLMDRILCLDLLRTDKEVLRVIRTLPAGPDTLWSARVLEEHWSPGEKSYVVVVGGVAVPDSVRVVLADGSSFVQAVERKRK